MAAITGSLTVGTQLVGYKIVHITATPTSASDTITLTAATHGIASITGIVGAVITSGMDANLQTLQVSASGLVLTVVSKGADGNAATDWTSASISITVIGATNS